MVIPIFCHTKLFKNIYIYASYDGFGIKICRSEIVTIEPYTMSGLRKIDFIKKNVAPLQTTA